MDMYDDFRNFQSYFDYEHNCHLNINFKDSDQNYSMPFLKNEFLQILRSDLDVGEILELFSRDRSDSVGVNP